MMMMMVMMTMMMIMMMTTTTMGAIMMATMAMMSAAAVSFVCSYGTRSYASQLLAFVVELCKVRVLQARHSKDGPLLLVVLTSGILARHDLDLVHLRA